MPSPGESQRAAARIGDARLDAIGTALRAVLDRLPGTRSAVFESLGGETWLDFAADPAELARLRVDPAAVRRAVDLVTTGGAIGVDQEAPMRPAGGGRRGLRHARPA